LILVDTSVWVDHLRRGDAQLADLLKSNAVIMHPFVVGEIACGSLLDRALTLDLLLNLPAALVAEPDEALVYLDQHSLYGKGIGYVDVHLLASAAISGAKFWTRDKRLRMVAQELLCALVDASER
jgi:predicted nucleic acid-binding protein